VDIFRIERLQAERRTARQLYHEFLRVPALSAGLYELPAGGTDPQSPHTEDELYYVVAGRGAIRVGNEDAPVETDTVIYVAAGVEHRFHSITEDLSILVFFAPAETSSNPHGEEGE